MTAIDERELVRAVTRAMENAGTLPAKDSVKLVPEDWHRICDLVLDRQAALRPGSTGETEGWVLVPKEPTMKMLESGMAAMRVALSDGLPRDQRQAAGYRAMLAAAGGRHE